MVSTSTFNFFHLLNNSLQFSLKKPHVSRNRFSLQVEDWVLKSDVDHDGVVSYEEFKFSLAGNMMIDL